VRAGGLLGKYVAQISAQKLLKRIKFSV